MLPIEKNREECKKRVRLRLYKEHLGYLDAEFVEAFQCMCQVPKMNRWIRQKVEQEFGIPLRGKADIERWNQELKTRFYESPVEWVKETMRREMYPSYESKIEILGGELADKGC